MIYLQPMVLARLEHLFHRKRLKKSIEKREVIPSHIFTLKDTADFTTLHMHELWEDELKRLAEGTIRLINLCVTRQPEALFFLDRSARPGSVLFRITWKLLFPHAPIPKVRHINVGTNNKNRFSLASTYTMPNFSYIHEHLGPLFVIDESIGTGTSVKTASNLVRQAYPNTTVTPMEMFNEFPSWYGKMSELMGLSDTDNTDLLSRRSNKDQARSTRFRQDLTTLANAIAQQVDAHPLGSFIVVPSTGGKSL